MRIEITTAPNLDTVPSTVSDRIVLQDDSDSNNLKVSTVQDVSDLISAPLTTAINGKQATLVSGTNIKTINGTTLLGSGDLIVTGSTDYGRAYALAAGLTTYGY